MTSQTHVCYVRYPSQCLFCLWFSEYLFTIILCLQDLTRRYVRVVKETDLKSVGLRPRRFEPCCRRLLFWDIEIVTNVIFELTVVL